MRSVQITRKKSFFGALIPYFIFVGYPKTETTSLDQDDMWDFPEKSDIKVSNGQTITFPIQDEKCSIIVWAQTSTGAACGPAYYIDEGTTDIDLELVTQYSWWNGSRYVLRPVTARHCRACGRATSSNGVLFRKKPVGPAKIYFSVYPCSMGWEIYLVKPKSDTTPFPPPIAKPEISIHYQPELDTESAKVTIYSGNTKVVMKASMFSGETRVLDMELYGYDQNNRLVVSFDEGNSCITAAPDGMQHSLEGERFVYHCLAESIGFMTGNQTVMQMYPAFNPNRIGTMQINGWILESHLGYLPYLGGILGYSRLM